MFGHVDLCMCYMSQPKKISTRIVACGQHIVASRSPPHLPMAFFSALIFVFSFNFSASSHMGDYEALVPFSMRLTGKTWNP